MKGKFITLVLTLGFLAAFGVFMHSPPSILDGLTGATPKAKRAAQMAAPLEGNYLFCINPALEPFSDADFRNDLKAFVSGETEVLSDAGLPHMTLSVCETDYPLGLEKSTGRFPIFSGNRLTSICNPPIYGHDQTNRQT